MNMKRIKKTGALVLLGIMLTFSACGQKDAAPGAKQGAEETQAAVKTQTAAGAVSSEAYTVTVRAEDGSPVEGVTIQFCTDSLCMLGVTEKDGSAAFEAEKAEFTVHVLKVPEGFAEDPETYEIAPDSPGAEITLKEK